MLSECRFLGCWESEFEAEREKRLGALGIGLVLVSVSEDLKARRFVFVLESPWSLPSSLPSCRRRFTGLSCANRRVLLSSIEVFSTMGSLAAEGDVALVGDVDCDDGEF